MPTGEQSRSFENDDAAYAATLYSRSPAARAAWSSALLRVLPPAPARVLDIGARTGSLSLALARLGFHVTVLDPAENKLARLTAEASQLGLPIRAVHGDSADPPADDFDAVVERHVLWTLPDPPAALSAWLKAAPTGRLALFEILSGSAGHPVEQARATKRELLHRLRSDSPDDHSPYIREPHATRTSPEQLAALVQAAGWAPPQTNRLPDIEWAHAQELPPLERLYGVTPCFAVVAVAPTGSRA